MIRPRFRGSLFVFAVLAALFVSTVPGSGSAFRNLKEGAPAIAFTLPDVEGKEVAYAPDSGKVTVLSFVDLSQDRSKEQIKDLVDLHAELASKGVDFLLVTKYTNTAEEAKKAAAEFGVRFPVLLDKDQKVYGDYGLFILPSTAVIGKDGKFAFEHSSHSRDFRDLVGGKVKVLAGLMTEDEYRKRITPVESAHKSKEQSEAERLLALGHTLRKQGMGSKATEKFAKAVELDPVSLDGRLSYGEALVAEKKYDEALAQFLKAKEISPDSREVKLGLGMVHLEKGETDKAIEEISGAALLNPKPQKAYYWLGIAYEKKGDLPNAVKYYRKAVEKLLHE